MNKLGWGREAGGGGGGGKGGDLFRFLITKQISGLLQKLIFILLHKRFTNQ